MNALSLLKAFDYARQAGATQDFNVVPILFTRNAAWPELPAVPPQGPAEASGQYRNEVLRPGPAPCTGFRAAPQSRVFCRPRHASGLRRVGYRLEEYVRNPILQSGVQVLGDSLFAVKIVGGVEKSNTTHDMMEVLGAVLAEF